MFWIARKALLRCAKVKVRARARFAKHEPGATRQNHIPMSEGCNTTVVLVAQYFIQSSRHIYGVPESPYWRRISATSLCLVAAYFSGV